MIVKMKILCEQYKHKKIMNKKIIVNEASEEYYIIPITKEFTVNTDGDIYELVFKNQLLWLKYSNYKKEIVIKELFTECIIIKSEDILNIEVDITCNNYFLKNVWQSNNNVRLNSRYDGKYMLCLPVFDDLINIHEFGVGLVKDYRILLNTNEVLLVRTVPQEHNCSLMVSNNFLLNKEALFIRVSDDFVSDFIL